MSWADLFLFFTGKEWTDMVESCRTLPKYCWNSCTKPANENMSLFSSQLVSLLCVPFKLFICCCFCHSHSPCHQSQLLSCHSQKPAEGDPCHQSLELHHMTVGKRVTSHQRTVGWRQSVSMTGAAMTQRMISFLLSSNPKRWNALKLVHEKTFSQM